VKIIDFLKQKNCVFMKPSEYLATLDKSTAATDVKPSK